MICLLNSLGIESIRFADTKWQDLSVLFYSNETGLVFRLGPAKVDSKNPISVCL